MIKLFGDPAVEDLQQELLLLNLDIPSVRIDQDRKAVLATMPLVERFLLEKGTDGASEAYLVGRRKRLGHFARLHRELPGDPEQIREYLRRFKGESSHRQDLWKTLGFLYRYALKNGYIEKNPILEIDKPKFRKKSPQRLSRGQAKTLLQAAGSELEWGLLACYFGLRLRRVEAERLRWGDVKDDYVLIKGKERTEELPLLSEFHSILLELKGRRGARDPVFWSQRKAPMTAEAMAWHIGEIFKRAGIAGVRGSPHTLRTTSAALWSVFGGDASSNRQLLRHSTSTGIMTDHYSQSTIDELRDKDMRHNPMLCIMRELGLVETVSISPNTSSAPLC